MPEPRHVRLSALACELLNREYTELAVRAVIHGEEVKNKQALANPEALDLYAGLEALTE